MTSSSKKILGLGGIGILVVIGIFFAVLQSWANEKRMKELAEEAEGLTYYEMLESGLKPGLSPKDEFPTHYQYLNGCFGYAVGHILQHRGEEFDPLDMEKRIQKPREELWGREYKTRLAKAYDLDLQSFKKTELFFDLLAQGEPVVVSYVYPLGKDEWVLHAVAAYSFDEKGVWVSDTLSGKRIRLNYDQVFTEGGDKTLYPFTRVVRN